MADFTLRLRRYDPESGERAVLGRAHDRPRAAPLGPRGDPPGQGALRRLDRHPLLVPRGDLRLVRRADQRPAGARLPHAPRHRQGGRRATAVIEVEPMGNMPVIKDLIVDMDAVHWKKIQRVTPWLSTRSRSPSASTSSRTRTWSTSRSRWPASSAAPASRTASRWRSTRSSSARPRWRRPTASSATRATPQQYERLKDLAEDPAGIYDCTHCFKCIEACPKGVAPMSQIMRLRRRAGSDHHIVDRNNGERHERAITYLVTRLRPAVRGRDAAALLRRLLVVREVPPVGRARARRLAAGDREGAAARARSPPARRCAATRSRGPDLKSVKRDLRHGRGQGRPLRAEPVHLRLRRGRRAARRPRPPRPARRRHARPSRPARPEPEESPTR